MPNQRICLGFDLRVEALLPKELTHEHRFADQFLVNREIMISGDPAVWQRTVEIDKLLNESVGNLSNPLTLIQSLEAINEACRQGAFSIDGMQLVALTTSEANVVALYEHYGSGWFDGSQTEAQLLSEGWMFRGFDVLDLRGLISGLNGCGYRPEAKSMLRTYFDEALNEVGLFRTYDWASQFAEVRGLEIYSHAPFIPTGVLTQVFSSS